MGREDEPPGDLGRDQQGRGRVRILRVFTGVPRGDEEVPPSEPTEPIAHTLPFRYNYPPAETV
jgi:hypothetical protein